VKVKDKFYIIFVFNCPSCNSIFLCVRIFFCPSPQNPSTIHTSPLADRHTKAAEAKNKAMPWPILYGIVVAAHKSITKSNSLLISSE
jgi:hypothetical protein